MTTCQRCLAPYGALDYVGNPYNVYGRTVNNLPPSAGESDDKKRKASRSLSHATTPGQEEEGQVEENCERYEHEIDYRLWDVGSSKSL